jgi:hypothetical protein
MAEHGHGHSIAAWTAVTILLLAAALIGVGIALQVLWLDLVGVALVVVGVVAGKVLAMAGFGQDKPDNAEGVNTAVR